MAIKRKPASEPLVATGAAPAREARKHSPAKRPIPAEGTDIPSSKSFVSSNQDPSFEEIATLAYSYWEARGCQGGSAEEDWLRAEQELRNRVVAAHA